MKLLTIFVLCLGFSIQANAQQNALVTDTVMLPLVAITEDAISYNKLVFYADKSPDKFQKGACCSCCIRLRNELHFNPSVSIVLRHYFDVNYWN